MDATELDRRFDEGLEEVLSEFDRASETRPNRVEQVAVDVPAWVVEAIDHEAERLGLTRQSVLQIWIAERLGVRVVETR